MKLPKIIEEVGFNFHWGSRKVWELDEPVVDMDIDELIWHFDIPFWEMKDTDDYNLTPIERRPEPPARDEDMAQRLYFPDEVRLILSLS